MHTDEYEISLLRELEICKKYVHSIQKSLQEMEKKYNLITEKFVKGYRRGIFSADNGDFAAWFKACEELKKWGERKKEYEKVYRLMKI